MPERSAQDLRGERRDAPVRTQACHRQVPPLAVGQLVPRVVVGLTILIAAATRLLLAAPGAVLIQGRVTPRENGLISLAGPGTNFVVAGLAIGGYAIGLASSPNWGVDVDDFMPALLIGVARINGVLALFNLVPLGPLDGRKVLRWNPVTYGFALALAIVLMVVVHLYDPA